MDLQRTTSGEPHATPDPLDLRARDRVDAAVPTAQPVLRRVERQIDRRGKLGRRHVEVAPPQLEHELPQAVRVALARVPLTCAQPGFRLMNRTISKTSPVRSAL